MFWGILVGCVAVAVCGGVLLNCGLLVAYASGVGFRFYADLWRRFLVVLPIGGFSFGLWVSFVGCLLGGSDFGLRDCSFDGCCFVLC